MGMDKITIIFEDENVLVLNKPAGLVVHGDGRTEEETLSDWLIENYPEIEKVGEPWKEIPRPGIVHRLDRDTTGVMIIAKNQDTYEFLKDQFKEREVKKEYLAFAYDHFKEEEGEIDRAIGKSKSDFRRWSAQPGSRGVQREALTLWEALKEVSFGSKVYTYMRLTPKTGRTHQLRVHLKAIHHPIVCDSLYAPKRECALGFNRLALHASKLTVELPGGEVKEFEAPLPEDFKSALEIA
ncbi:RluA family pseudouridine synthase [Candidatus Kaiserbacteria bacterium]|nr:MAG: RluA family pseudouridine synthase [Candidatus Kaiserbacteria bacterium]